MKKLFSISTLNEKFLSPGMILFFSMISLGIAYFIASTNFTFSILLIVLLVGIPIILFSIVNVRAGFLLLFTYSSFAFFISRALTIDAPMGVIIEIMFLPLMLGVAVKRPKLDFKQVMKEPVVIALLVWFAYILVEALNPAGSMQAWLYGIRINLRLLFIFIISSYIFTDQKYLKKFIILWILIALISSLYGYYQEFIGLPPYDLNWATESLQRKQLLFIGGHWRKWSILSGATEWGMFMAISSLLCLTLSFGPYKPHKRAFLFIIGLAMMVSIAFSGTRTANAMFVVGIAFYIVSKLNDWKSFAVIIVFGTTLLAVLFGPFNNKTVNRIRSTFKPENDPSYMVREVNQERIRPYLLSHPIGGGLMTTGGIGEKLAPGNSLAGFPTDSYYVKTGLETGWIGFILQLILFAAVMIEGIKNYFKSNGDPMKQNIILALNISFFALTVGGFSQVAIDQLPYGIIFNSYMAIVLKMKYF